MHQTGDFSINPRQSQADFWPERDATLPAPQQHDPCPVCGRPVEQYLGERVDRWLARVSCSERCRARLISLSLAGRPKPRGRPGKPHAPCVNCEGPVIRREGETNANYTRRRTCSVHCALDRSSQRSNQRQPSWPEITNTDGDPGGRFDDYDVRVRSFSPVRHDWPATHVETQHPLGGL
jgi:hypothetical protein